MNASNCNQCFVGTKFYNDVCRYGERFVWASAQIQRRSDGTLPIAIKINGKSLIEIEYHYWIFIFAFTQ